MLFKKPIRGRFQMVVGETVASFVIVVVEMVFCLTDDRRRSHSVTGLG